MSEALDEVRVAEVEALWQTEYRTAYAGWLLSLVSTNTRDNYRSAVEVWLRWSREHGIDPVTPGRGACGVWMADMEREGLAPATRRLRMVAVRSWHTMLTVECLRENRDPWARVKTPKVDDVSSVIPPDDAEVRALLAGAEAAGGDALTCVLILATMGLRASEAAQVRADTVASSRWGPVATIVGKGGRRKLAPIPPIVQRAHALAGRWPCDPSTVGPRRVGRPIGKGDRHRIGALLERAAARAGVEVHPHALRHWYAATARRRGVTLQDLQDSMDHLDPKTTRRYDRAASSLDNHATWVVAASLEEEEQDDGSVS